MKENNINTSHSDRAADCGEERSDRAADCSEKNIDRASYYSLRAASLKSDIARLKRRSRICVAVGLAAFVAAVAAVAAYTVYGGWWWLCCGALMAVGYIVARRLDVSCCDRMERRTDLCTVYENELKYLSGDFTPFDDGRRYADAAHPFAYDMDIFGAQSLFHRINRTVTSGGSDRLATMLSVLPQDREDAENGGFIEEKGSEEKQSEVVKRLCGEIERQREAVDALAGMEPLCTEFISRGIRGHIDTASVKSALRTVKTMEMPGFAHSIVALVLSWASIAGFFASVLLCIFTSIPSGLTVLWGTANLFIALMLCTGPLKKIGSSAGRLHKELRAYGELVEIIVRHGDSPVAATDSSAIATAASAMMTGAPAADSSSVLTSITADLCHSIGAFDDLRRILDGLDRRGNVLGLIFFDALFLSDIFLVRRFRRWQKAYTASIDRWIDEVSMTDALVSMGTFRYNEPSAGRAEIVDSIELTYEARDLWHPFLGARAVRNDFTIDGTHYYIVTGANMAGKSTFLRSLGVNYILAMNGMPVFAESFRVSLFSLFSSMRTSDDLAHGISYFNAELLRLRQLIDHCRGHRHTLIILDEILKGTNSLDKLNGSRMFLEAISHLPVSGVIATHDLELSRMADDETGRFHNFCFEIRLSDEITYTYKITPGVARNQNATHLLKGILADVLR